MKSPGESLRSANRIAAQIEKPRKNVLIGASKLRSSEGTGCLQFADLAEARSMGCEKKVFIDRVYDER